LKNANDARLAYIDVLARALDQLADSKQALDTLGRAARVGQEVVGRAAGDGGTVDGLALCIVDVVDARGEAGERDGVGSGGGGGEQREAEREVAE
jgi:hypothetical protein